MTNKWFPLKPGTKLTYQGTKDGKSSRDVFVVEPTHKRVGDVLCTVVSDALYLDGKLEERTTDYYAQDAAGNVWYFGEDTAELDEYGNVTGTEGSWQAGRDGAKAGIYIDANPSIGKGYRQEYYKGHAEDTYVVSSLDSPVTVPYRIFPHTLVTRETTALEPDVVDNKYYAEGVGVVAELSIAGPTEQNKLVSVLQPG